MHRDVAVNITASFVIRIGGHGVGVGIHVCGGVGIFLVVQEAGASPTLASVVRFFFFAIANKIEFAGKYTPEIVVP
jgi:short subunit fatty acids transporter